MAGQQAVPGLDGSARSASECTPTQYKGIIVRRSDSKYLAMLQLPDAEGKPVRTRRKEAAAFVLYRQCVAMLLQSRTELSTHTHTHTRTPWFVLYELYCWTFRSTVQHICSKVIRCSTGAMQGC